MASSTEEVSVPDLSVESRRNENDHFGVFKDFDFLEYESESVEVNKYSYFKIDVQDIARYITSYLPDTKRY